VCFTDAQGQPDTSKLETVTKQNLPDIKFLIKRNRAYVTLPLIGRDSGLDAGRAGEEASKVLDEEGIKVEDFAVPTMPDLASAGLRREILLRAKPVMTSSDNTATFRFFLPRGCYATTVLREYMKSSPERMD
jgi:tRNA pseudouridine13 synthase